MRFSRDNSWFMHACCCGWRGTDLQPAVWCLPSCCMQHCTSCQQLPAAGAAALTAPRPLNALTRSCLQPAVASLQETMLLNFTLHYNNQQQELITNSMHLIEHLISQCMFLVYAFVSVFASRYIWEEIRNRNPYSNIPLIFIPKCTKLQKFELVFTNLSKVFKKIETSSNRLTSH